MKASVGSQLREARLLRRLTLEEVSRETHIKLHYLEALEADAFERLPSLFQARGFLRVYGSFLGLDSEALVNQLDSQKGSGDKPTSSFGPEQSPPSSASAAEPEAQGLENASRNDPPLRETSLSEQASGEAQAIFSQIGAELRRIRTHLGLSIEEVERQTHLRAHHIQIMEEGKFDRLASPMQGRGFLQIYASFLGLNSDVLLLRYAEALQAQLADRRGRVPRPRVEEVRPAHGQSYSWLWSAEFLIMVLLS
ncbi:MAG: helix-turn-helix domain-containing protein, partial [Anaerolineales bacterium]|nr:helix-turn-helix domain-containing protein [Anaerolineales bacterium]MDW8446788.1 helix-turn-helix domain-containing protein [Anaerolineales bacterium]